MIVTDVAAKAMPSLPPRVRGAVQLSEHGGHGDHDERDAQQPPDECEPHPTCRYMRYIRPASLMSTASCRGRGLMGAIAVVVGVDRDAWGDELVDAVEDPGRQRDIDRREVG